MSKTKFEGKIVFIGCGSIAQGALPLVLRHIDIKPENIYFLSNNEGGKKVAEKFGANFIVNEIRLKDYEEVLGKYCKKGDFLVNLAINVESILLMKFCLKNGILYTDTCNDSWDNFFGGLSYCDRTIYKYRENTLKLKEKDTPTSLITHGADPGLVSHFVKKKALLNIAKDNELEIEIPKTKNEWAKLAQKLNIQTIHISERDTQICKGKPKKK